MFRRGPDDDSGRTAEKTSARRRKGVSGSLRQTVRQPIKRRRFSPAIARERRCGCRAIQSRSCAVKRATVGGWMTARWSGVFTNARRKRRVRKGPQLERRRVFPRRAKGSPKVVLPRVLVTRTSVVETSSRHLDDARKWSREARRAAASSDGEGCRPGRGRPPFTSQKGVPVGQGRKPRCQPPQSCAH
jgi:hypothetical protein